MFKGLVIVFQWFPFFFARTETLDWKFPLADFQLLTRGKLAPLEGYVVSRDLVLLVVRSLEDPALEPLLNPGEDGHLLVTRPA